MCQAVSASAACCMTMSTSASFILCFCVVRFALFMAGDGNLHEKICWRDSLAQNSSFSQKFRFYLIS